MLKTYIVYKKNYYSKEEVQARNQRFRQNEVTRCPSCDEAVSCYLSGSHRFKVDYVQNIATIQKGEDGKTLFIRQWHLCRDRTARWGNIPEYLEEICRYAVRGDKVAKWQAELKSTFYYAAYRSRTNWTRMGNASEVYDGSYYFFLPENWKRILSGTSLQYCDLSGYCNGTDNLVRDRNTIRFLMDWARYPAIEKLWKAGYHQLIHKRISCPQKEYRNTIRWNRDSIREAVRFPMRLLKIHAPEDWTMEDMQKVTDQRNCVWCLGCSRFVVGGNERSGESGTTKGKRRTRNKVAIQSVPAGSRIPNPCRRSAGC